MKNIKGKKIVIAIAIVIVIFIIIGMAVSSNKESTEQENTTLSENNKRLNQLGLFIDDSIKEEYNEQGDLISLTSSNGTYKFEYVYIDGKVNKFVGTNAFDDSRIEMNITYNSLGNVETLTTKSKGSMAENFKYIYGINNKLERIECQTSKINYYYTTQNINGTDYIIEEIVDMSNNKITSTKVCKDIEYDMSSHIIGTYFIPLPYYNDENSTFVLPNNSSRLYNTTLRYREYSPILLKNIVYTQKDTYVNATYLNNNGQIVISKDATSRRTYNYEKIDNTSYYMYKLERFDDSAKELMNVSTNYTYVKWKITYDENCNIKEIQSIEEKNIDAQEYYSMISEYEKKALDDAVTYRIKLKSYKD